MIDCNCSICIRVSASSRHQRRNDCPICGLSTNGKTKNAYIWVYLQGDQTAVEGREHLSYRIWNQKVSRKSFCKYCGVHLFNEANPISGKLHCSSSVLLTTRLPFRPLLQHKP